MFGKKIYIMVAAIALGALIVTQMRSFGEVNSMLIRDTQSNVFQEIKILKAKNEDLSNEIEELESTLEQLADQNLALQAIEEEIEKYKKLSGEDSIFGAGVTLTIDADLTTPWVIDLVNEFWNSGVQAVSVNGIRITNQAIGFDTYPQGQIFLNGAILSSPYVFSVIGEPSTIIGILELPGGIFDRLEDSLPEIVIKTEEKEIIQMD